MVASFRNSYSGDCIFPVAGFRDILNHDRGNDLLDFNGSLDEVADNREG
jgi:hypothetical protein